MNLVNEFKDTRKQSKTTYGKCTKKLMKHDTYVYTKGVPAYKVVNSHTPIEVVAGGTVEIGYQLAEDYTVAVLNFADAITPGGLVEVGGTTQEENICRCTNLYESITTKRALQKYYEVNRKHDRVEPSVYTNALIYSRDVAVFKDDVTYDVVPTRFFDVITCPAPAAILKDDYAMRVYLDRLEQIILSAIDNDANAIVLGAWGCGAFCQNPYLVAEAFVDVLNKYSGYFEKVVFAIRPTPSGMSFVGNKDNSTLGIFERVIKYYYEGEVIS